MRALPCLSSPLLETLVGLFQPALGLLQLADLGLTSDRDLANISQLGLELSRCSSNALADHAFQPVGITLALQAPQLLGLGLQVCRHRFQAVLGGLQLTTMIDAQLLELIHLCLEPIKVSQDVRQAHLAEDLILSHP